MDNPILFCVHESEMQRQNNEMSDTFRGPVVRGGKGDFLVRRAENGFWCEHITGFGGERFDGERNGDFYSHLSLESCRPPRRRKKRRQNVKQPFSSFSV